MKKISALFLALILLSLSFTALAVPAPRDESASVRFGGYVAGDFSGGSANSWVGFDSSDPSVIDVYDSMVSTYAAAYYDGFVYGYVYGYDSEGVLHDQFYRLKSGNYFVEFIEGASSGGVLVYGMAYNYTDDTMYALCDEDHPYIASVDLETGVLAKVVDIELGSLLGVQTFAIDGEGNFYFLALSALNSRLMHLNPATGELSVMFATNLPCYYAQSMTWDPATDAIYWAQVDSPSSSTNGLYRIDVESSSVTYLGMIGGGLEIMGLHSVSAPEPEPYLKGDINHDGSVDSSDALLALRYSMGINDLDEYGLTAGDVNDDGAVDSTDALLILRYAIGISDEL